MFPWIPGGAGGAVIVAVDAVAGPGAGRSDTPDCGASLVARDALAAAFERGLFAAPFGPAYHRGFVDCTGATPVIFARDDDDGPRRRARRRLAIASFAVSGAALTAATVTGALALQALPDWHATDLQRPAADARTRYETFNAASLATLGFGLATVAVGAAVFPWHARATAR